MALFTIRRELAVANLLLLNIALGLSLTTSLLSVYFDKIGISLANIGIIFGIGAIAAGFLRIPLGTLVDCLGRKKFVMLGAIGYPLFAFGLTLAKTPLHFIGLDLLLELSAAIFWTAFSAHYFDILSKGKEGAEMASRNIVQYGAVTIAPFLAGLIAENLGFTNLFYIGAAIAALGFPIAATLIKDHDKHKGNVCLNDFSKEYEDISKIKGFRTIFFVLVINTLTWTFWAIYMPIFLQQNGFSFSQIGLIITATFGIGTLLQYPLGKAIDKFPAKYLIIPGFGLVFLGSLIFFSFRNYFSYLFGRVVAGLGWDISYWPTVGVFVRVTPKKEHGGAWGIMMAGVAWAYGIGAIIGGTLTENFGIERVLQFSAFVALLVGLVLLSSKILAQKANRFYKRHHRILHTK